MRFYLVDEHVAACDRIIIGYFHYYTDAYQEFMKSEDRRLTEFELNKENVYRATSIWDHIIEEVEL